MGFIEITKDDGVAIIGMKHGDSNAFNMDFHCCTGNFQETL